MSTPSKGVIASLLFGALSFASLFYYYFFVYRQPSTPLLTDAPAAPGAVKKAASAAVAVEDVGDSDDEDEDSDDDAEVEEQVSESQAKAAELKEAYDAAVRVASKLIKGEDHVKAAEKLSEAIKLAAQVPSVTSKDLVALYNNRSAMNEKAGAFEDALRDIKIVLTMDPFHIKARLRRARVLEAQGKLKLAVVDLFFCMFRDQSLQQDHGHARKLETLVKQLASARAQEIIAQMLKGPENGERTLPSHGFVRNALEAYMCLPAWREDFGVERKTALLEALETARAGTDSLALAASGLDVVRYHFVHNDIRHSFAVLAELAAALPSAVEQASAEDAQAQAVLFHLYEFLGFRAHMLCDMDAAAAMYDKALQIDASHTFVLLKKAAVLMELHQVEAAQAIYMSMLSAHESADGAVDRAWVYFHRASMHVARDASGAFPADSADALQQCIADLELAVADSEPLLAREDAKMAHFNSLLKLVHVRTHVKQQMGVQASEQDAEANKECLQKATALFPAHDSLLIMQASALADAGDFDEAVQLVDRHCHRAGNTLDQSSALIIKASIVAAKALMLLMGATSMAEQAEGQRLFAEEVCQYYEKALSVDAQSLEVLCQYAQTKSMLGDAAGCVHLLQQAVPLVKARDEAFDISVLLAQSEAQQAAMQELIAAQQ